MKTLLLDLLLRFAYNEVIRNLKRRGVLGPEKSVIIAPSHNSSFKTINSDIWEAIPEIPHTAFSRGQEMDSDKNLASPQVKQ
jgi:uncharacterized protein YbcC (UPF0753/DUF2309 family)